MTDNLRDEVTLTKASVGVSGSASDEARELLDAMSALIDWSAHAVCEPRRFHENENSAQQELGRAVARARRALTESGSLVGLSADVSRLTDALLSIDSLVDYRLEWSWAAAIHGIVSDVLASLRDAGEEKP